MYCICQQVYCIYHHVHQGLAWVYCICKQVHWIYHQVYCRDNHVHQEPHLGVLHLPSSVLWRPCCTSGAPLWCTAFAIKCTEYPVIMAVATTEADKAITSFVFVQIMGMPLKKLLGGVIFGHFASRKESSCLHILYKVIRACVYLYLVSGRAFSVTDNHTFSLYF